MKCSLNYCPNEQGAGTWVRVDEEVYPVCEEHWQALRAVHP